jgi:catechol-2,3-dioxygenase
MNITGGVHHIAVLVRDLAVMETFYREVLGLPVLRRDGQRSVWLDLGAGAFLALETSPVSAAAAAPATAGDDGERPGLHLLALRIARDERDAWARRFAEAGVDVYRRTAYTLYVRDPEGNRLGVSHFPEEASG